MRRAAIVTALRAADCARATRGISTGVGRGRGRVRTTHKFVPKPEFDPIQMLDMPAPAVAGKLSRSLAPKPKQELDSRTDGVLKVTAQDIADDLNDALATDKLSKIFGAVGPTDQVVEITSVVLNKDCSHADAVWYSPIFHAFVQRLSRKATVSAREFDLAEKMAHNITDKLQRNESKFRSHIIRTMNFRRVPRVFFKPNSRINGVMVDFEVALHRAGISKL